MVSPAFVSGAVAPLRAAPRTTSVCRARTAPTMSVRRNVAKLSAVVPPALVAAPALAEGTGEAFGVDNALLLIPFILVPLVFLFLFLQFDGSQDKSDFTGQIDDRRR